MCFGSFNERSYKYFYLSINKKITQISLLIRKCSVIHRVPPNPSTNKFNNLLIGLSSSDKHNRQVEKPFYIVKSKCIPFALVRCEIGLVKCFAKPSHVFTFIYFVNWSLVQEVRQVVLQVVAVIKCQRNLERSILVTHLKE